MPFRLIMPSPKGRGAGLGNEMIPWAKAIIAGDVLNAKVLTPAWGLNSRGYKRYFGTSHLDWLAYRIILHGLPRFKFDETAYYAHGGGELAQAIRSFAQEQGLEKRGAWVIEMEGLWGGLDMLAPARMPLLAALLGTRYTAGNLAATDIAIPPEKLRIAMHVRRGDFGTPVERSNYRGIFNVALPIEWYAAVARSFVKAFGEKVHFLVVSDAPEGELAPIMEVTSNITTTSGQRFTDISDLLAMAYSDFIVCSISSFSLWASMFSQSHYGWYAPHLSLIGDSATVWGHEAAQQKPGSPTMESVAQNASILASGGTLRPRGIAIGASGSLPDELLVDLQRIIERKRRSTDLIRYGAVPINSRSA